MLDDCELVALAQPRCLRRPATGSSRSLAAAEQHPEFAAFASTIERADGSGHARFRRRRLPRLRHRLAGPPGQPPPPRRAAPEEVFGPSGAAALYRRDWLLRVGGFDERYFCYFEDVDLNLRLQVAGGRCLYVPEARVRHVGGASSGGLSTFTIYHSQRNLVWTFVKSMPPHIFWRYLPMHVLLNLGSIVTYGARGHTRTLLRAKRDAMLGLPAMVRARRSVMRSRRSTAPRSTESCAQGRVALLRETRS